NLNFGNPERPEIMGQIVGCIEGMREAGLALDFPVVSGNVSLYNETNGSGILPTPTIGGLGVVDDLAAVPSTGFTADGEVILLIGETAGHLGASAYLRDIEGREEGAPPPVDLAVERRNGDFVRSLIADGIVTACHDVSDGGLFVTVAEMALAGNMGAAIEAQNLGMPIYAWLFGEDQARYVVATMAPERVLAAASAAGVPVRRIGFAGGDALTVNGDYPISLAALRGLHEAWLPDYMNAAEATATAAAH